MLSINYVVIVYIGITKFSIMTMMHNTKRHTYFAIMIIAINGVIPNNIIGLKFYTNMGIPIFHYVGHVIGVWHDKFLTFDKKNIDTDKKRLIFSFVRIIFSHQNS